MRKILIGLGVIAAGVALIPFAMGFVVERDIRNLVQHANTSHDVVVTLKDYHRGWFTSTADLEARVKQQDPTLGDGDLLIHANEIIRHGPIFREGSGFGVGRAVIESDIILPDALAIALTALFEKGKDQIQIIHRTKITMFKNFESTISIPKFTLLPRGQGSITWEGFQGDMTLSSNYKATNGQFKLNGMKVDTPMVNAIIGVIQMNYKTNNQDDKNGTAIFDYKQPSVNVILFGQPVFAMDNFEVTTETNLKENILSQSIKSQIGKSAVTNVVFGPGQLQMMIENINAEPLTQIADVMQALQSDKTMTETQREAKLNQTLASSLPKILANQPSLTLTNFQMQMPAGEVQASGRVSLKPMAPNVEPTVYLNAPENWIIKANLFIPPMVMEDLLYKNMYGALQQEQQTQAMVAQQQGAAFTPVADDVLAAQAKEGVKAQLQLWTEKGYLKMQDARYKMDVQMQDGKLTVNSVEVAYH